MTEFRLDLKLNAKNLRQLKLQLKIWDLKSLLKTWVQLKV